MIRVLQVLGGLNRGGAESMIMNLYRNIDRTKIQFDFVVHSENPEKEDFYSEIIALGGSIYKFPKFSLKTVFRLKKLWNEFFETNKEYRILHSHVRSYASLYIPIAKKHGIKTIIHSHSTSNGKGFSSIVKKVMQFPLRRQADFLFACSNEAGVWLFGEKACKKPNYKFIPNAIDVEQYKPNDEIRTQYRKEFGFGNEIVYGHVGRLHEAKNHDFLLNVFAELRKKNKNVKLLIVGDGELRSQIESKIKQLDIEKDVIMTGSRADVSNVLQAMDVFLFPSKWEGLPVTVVEAQASGLPCIISNKITQDVNLSELVKVLPIDNVNVWVEEAQQPIQRMNVLDKIVEAGFDVKKVAKDLEGFYFKNNT